MKEARDKRKEDNGTRKREKKEPENRKITRTRK